MTCPHGVRSQPATCSQCLVATPHIVTIVGADLLIDGKPAERSVAGEHVQLGRVPRKRRR